MKTLQKLSLALITLLLLASCEERGAKYLFPPERDIWKASYNKLDTPVVRQEKGILIEDFTGVQCTNCPKAATEIGRLMDAHSGRIVPVGIHSFPYIFTAPINDNGKKSTYDFRSSDGERLYEMLQINGQLPSGCVDRTKFGFAENLFMGYGDWNQAIEQKLSQTTPCNITIENVFSSSEQVVFKITTYYHEGVEEPQFVSAYILEDNLIDYQEDGSGYIADYEHKHVLRKMATQNTEGDLLANSTKTGDVFIQVYTVNISQGVEGEDFDTSWNPDNLSAVAFVHGKGGLNVMHAVDHKL